MTDHQADAVPLAAAPEALAGGAVAPDTATARRILALLHDGDIDAAIDIGLARFTPLAALGDDDNTVLAEARDRLLTAWAARARHRARAQRLERIAEARRRARSAGPSPTPTPTGPATSAAPQDAVTAPRSALPPAAAAALARARARAAGRQA